MDFLWLWDERRDSRCCAALKSENLVNAVGLLPDLGAA
jgi:hypothetical protein